MKKGKYFEKIKTLANSSPYYRLLGMKIKEINEGECRIELPFRKKLTHRYKIVHGGAIASLADSSVALALISLIEPDEKTYTIEFKINFFMPIRQGSLVAHAKIINKGFKTAVGDVNVTNAEGKLVAKVIATYSIKKETKV